MIKIFFPLDRVYFNLSADSNRNYSSTSDLAYLTRRFRNCPSRSSITRNEMLHRLLWCVRQTISNVSNKRVNRKGRFGGSNAEKFLWDSATHRSAKKSNPNNEYFETLRFAKSQTFRPSVPISTLETLAVDSERTKKRRYYWQTRKP